MRHLWLDPVGGLAGDMLLGALLDLGAELEAVRAGLEGLPLGGYRLEAEPVMRGPFAATHVRVLPLEGPTGPTSGDAGAAGPGDDHAHSHEHDHAHAHAHAHEHAHKHAHAHDAHPSEPAFPGQPERTWAAIRALLQEARLPERVRERALAVFGALAAAEAHVHGSSVEEVHFHEVGGVDALVDIVGCCLALELLGVERLSCGPLPVASGTIPSAHGPLPLPAPATLRLLEDFRLRPGRPGREQVTPTGAALVAALAEPGEPPAMVLRGSGTGAGTRDPADHPNVLRVLLGEVEEQPDSPVDIEVLTAQMDDLPGEALPPLVEALLAAGALDVTTSSVAMKKGRLGLRVEALSTPEAAPAVIRALLTHGSTFGVRRQAARRTVLQRHHEEVQTPFGPVRIKVGRLEGEVLQAAPEHEDVAARARAAGVPVPRVHSEALAAWMRLNPDR